MRQISPFLNFRIQVGQKIPGIPGHGLPVAQVNVPGVPPAELLLPRDVSCMKDSLGHMNDVHLVYMANKKKKHTFMIGQTK